MTPFQKFNTPSLALNSPTCALKVPNPKFSIRPVHSKFRELQQGIRVKKAILREVHLIIQTEAGRKEYSLTLHTFFLL